MATKADLSVDLTSDISYEFQAFDVDDNPLDITAVEDIVLTIKVMICDSTEFRRYSLADNISVVDYLTGKWQVTFPSSDTDTWPNIAYVYDMYLEFPNSVRYRAAQGSIYTDATITSI